MSRWSSSATVGAVLALMTASATVACGGSAPGAEVHGAEGASPRRSGAHTAFEVTAQGSSATLGHSLHVFEVSVTRRACSASGFPEIQVLDAHGALLDVTIGHDGGYVVDDAPPDRVILGGGRRAAFALETTPGNCEGEEPHLDVAQIAVSLPTGSSRVIVDFVTRVCPPGDGAVVVSPLRATAAEISRSG